MVQPSGAAPLGPRRAPAKVRRACLPSLSALDAGESALYDLAVIASVRRIRASLLALLVVLAMLGRERVNWTGTRTAEDASDYGGASVACDRDAR